MTTAAAHYADLLAPIYLWMNGGLDVALEAGRAELDALRLPDGRGRLAVDLGAGFGKHAIPLARRGWRVLALDDSPTLSTTLAAHRGDLPITTLTADLRDFERHVPEPPALVVCLGDTLTHLPAPADVDRLLDAAARVLAPEGALVLSFRDYTTPPVGDRRFIPVRADDGRILTCFLEDAGETIRVHDLLHERTADGWSLRASSYPKLRLDPSAIVSGLEARGLAAGLVASARMPTIVAARGPAGDDQRPSINRRPTYRPRL